MATPLLGTVIVDGPQADPWDIAFQDYQQALVDLDGDGRPDVAVPVRASDAARRRATGAAGAAGTDPNAPGGTLMDAAMFAAGPIARGVGMLGPRAIGGAVGGATALAPTEASPQVSLRNAQERQLQMEQRRMQMEQEAEAARQAREQQGARQASQDQLNADIRRQAAEAEQARINQQLERELADKFAEQERNKTFQQRYPGVTNALPMIGIAAAAGIPYAGRAIAQRIESAPIRNMNRTVREADRAALAQDAARISDMTPRLAQYNSDLASGAIGAAPTWGQSIQNHLIAGLTGGVASAEAQMFPEQWNYFNLPEGQRQEKAREAVFNPMNYVERGALGALTGIGSMHFPMTKAVPRSQDSIGIVEKYGTTPRSAQRAIDQSQAPASRAVAGQRDPTLHGPAPTASPTAQPSQAVAGPPLQPQLPPPAGGPNRSGRGPYPLTIQEQKALEAEIIAILRNRNLGLAGAGAASAGPVNNLLSQYYGPGEN